MSEGNTFGLNISVKTLMMIQILLVWSLVFMEIFLEEVRLDYIIPLYTLIWIMTYSDISKTEKAGRE
jgi:formate-dependent nitrite reductase membrane component NrfD